ncbi:MAG: LysR family transcriptional regulator [Bdellovibrionales bacterium]|nr:LysR family transcriptional regulator [Bdellovibrionales bacterium]
MIDMNVGLSPLYLRTFQKAYELKNFTVTARNLAMTQSGVSQHISQLESSLGTALFERVGRGIVPTKTADQLYKFSGKWLSEMGEFVQQIKLGENQMAGKIVFGAPGSFGVYLLKPIAQWLSQHPQLTLDYEYGPSSVIEKGFGSGRMDLGISSEPLDSRYFSNFELYQEEYVLVSHPAYKPKLNSWQEFSLNAVIDYVGSAPIFQKWIFVNYKKKITGFPFQSRVRINNMESIFALLQQDLGMTIFPREPITELLEAKN